MYQNESAPWLLFRAWNTDGTPKDDLVYNETGIVLYQSRNNEAKSTITLSNAASATDWAAGKFWQISGNLYRVGASTASISSYTGFITVQGSYTGGTLDGIAVEIVVVPSTHTAANVLTALGTGTWATAIPWNAAWDAEVQSEVDDALRALDLDSALIAQGAQRAVNVDVNHRVHSHVYDMQANTITASALAADAGAEIYAAFGTGSNLTALATQASVNDIPTNAEFAAAFPANFASLGINVSGHVSRVTLVDTTTTNTDMRGTDSALTDKAGFALSATGLDLVTAWTTDITGSLSGNVGGIAGTINTLDALDTAQDTQHGTTQDRLGYTLAALAGACADAGTAAETYAITIGVDTYTIDHTGLDATGNRGTATLTKS